MIKDIKNLIDHIDKQQVNIDIEEKYGKWNIIAIYNLNAL